MEEQTMYEITVSEDIARLLGRAVRLFKVHGDSELDDYDRDLLSHMEIEFTKMTLDMAFNAGHG